MRVLMLYRPRLPSLRAQAIQVVHAAHALAARGHAVTLLADRGEPPEPPEEVLAHLGLPSRESLDLRIARHRHPGLAGLWFRRALARWWRGPPGVVIARDKRRLVQAVRRLGKRHRIVLETHELDSALVADRGEDPAPIQALERKVLEMADALVANCGGTLAAWETAYAGALPLARRVCHNATSPARRRDAVSAPERVVRAVGSLRSYKGPATLVEAARRLDVPIELVGGSAAERSALTDLPPNLALLPPVPYPAVPDLLAWSAALVLPLTANRFGRDLTSPLKLWDYLATAVPIVAPDLPSIREIAALTGATLHWHEPDDPADLARAIRRALAAPPRNPILRTWDARAAEIESLL